MYSKEFRLSNHTAHTVVEQLSELVGYPINIMDSEGYVLASTDHSRIGLMHAGAREIVEKNLDHYYVDVDHPEQGVKKGVNLPILLNGTMVGVVGISGEIEQVENYGKLVKKMTELLCADKLLQTEKLLLQRARQRYIEELLTIVPSAYTTQLKESGKQLGIDTDAICTIMALDMRTPNLDVQQDQTIIDRMEKGLVRHIEGRGLGVVMLTGSHSYCLIYSKALSTLSSLVDELFAGMQNFPLYTLKMGISNRFERGDFKSGYLQSGKALESIFMLQGANCCYYSELSTEIFLHEISKASKNEYLAKIFGNCTESEVIKYARILSALYRNNGSIAATSQELFMHKNTLQYALNRLHDKTGYNPRSFEGAKLFMIGLDFMHKL